MSKDVRKSEVYFGDSVESVESVKILKTFESSQAEEYLYLHCAEDWSPFKKRVFWRDHRNINQEVSKRQIKKIRRRVRRELEKLKEMFIEQRTTCRIKSPNERVNLKDIFPQLRKSIIISKKAYECFFGKLLKKYSLSVANLQKVQQLFTNPEALINAGTSNSLKIAQNRAVKAFNRNPHAVAKINEKLRKRLAIIEKISSFLAKEEAQDFSLQELHTRFSSCGSNEAISLSLFRKYALAIGFKYANIKKSYRNTPKDKAIRINFLSTFLQYTTTQTDSTFFFDCSSVNDKSFKKKGWISRLRSKAFSPLYYFQSTHLLMLISCKSLVSFQFVKGNLNTEVIFSFFKTSFARLRAQNQKRKISIFMDNATMHRTMLMMNFFLTEEIEAVFIPPRNPYFNITEYLFRYIKRGLRKKFTLS